MQTYHLRRSEKEISDPTVMWDIIAGQKYMTLALCKDNVPYLATVNYGYDQAAGCLYFHCAGEGKKMDYLRANPSVWGQIVEDNGYLDGKCDHAFRAVQFQGRVVFVHAVEEKRHALALMIDRLESDPAAVKARLVTDKAAERVTIGKVIIEGMSGKVNGVA
ncbi:MAG TPA: pyridoxamine 5'-phosphate oxidase family protein [Anaerolineae bacterium]|nr:pyridoxamine 5'-phosphate oxidase family protein [Anaerolineae bacterium]HQI84992.1 pyridoxamine 5'-phosphate oxidase family protein [Anaerolineae bacterium]